MSKMIDAVSRVWHGQRARVSLYSWEGVVELREVDPVIDALLSVLAGKSREEQLVAMVVEMAKRHISVCDVNARRVMHGPVAVRLDPGKRLEDYVHELVDNE